MLLEVCGINAFYDVFQAIFDVSVSVESGEIVCLLGRNGAGKTTTLRSIIGLNEPSSGTIKFKGKKINGREPFQIARMGLCLVPENRMIFKDLTIRENLELGARGLSRKSFLARLERIYHLFPRLEHLGTRMGSQISGGEQQMLTIARSLMAEPELLLLDELSIGLAPIVIQSFKQQLKQLREQELSILLTEQNALFALDISDRAYVIDKGRIVYHGRVEDLKQDRNLMREYLGV